MYIDTHTRTTMEQSICKYFRITTEDLNGLFYKIRREAQNGIFFNDIKREQIVAKFIIDHPTDAVLDDIMFFHLSRRLNVAQDDNVGYNLAELLTKETALSSFFKKYNIEFYMENGHIEVLNQRNRVSFANGEKNVKYLRMRLGYDKDNKDYCFNGLAMKDLLYRNYYASALFGVPEFIENLATFLEKDCIKTDYRENSKYFCYEYRTPMEKIIFDSHDTLSSIEKEHHLIDQVLRRLYDYTVNDVQDMCDDVNPILRLADDDIMHGRYFISKEIISADMLCN